MNERLQKDYGNLMKNIELLKKNFKDRDDAIKTFQENYRKKKIELENKSKKIETLLLELQKEVNEVEKIKDDMIEQIVNKNESTNEKKEKKKLPYKKFYNRKSLLTELLEKKTYQAIYNIVFSYFIMNCISYFLNLYIEGKSPPINFQNIGEYINDYIHFIYYYVIKKLFIFFYIILINITPNLNQTINILILNFIVMINIFVFYNQKLLVTRNFSLLLRIIFYFDNANCILKMLSYFFEKKLFITYKIYCEYNKIKINIPKKNTIIIKDLGDSNNIEFEFKSSNILKEIKNFQKFYIISTYIYRDEYPKNKNNNKTINHFFNTIFCIIFCYLLFEICIIPLLININSETNLDIATFAYIFVSFILVSILGFFVLFFGLIHSFGNFSADLCNFGDRFFYSNFYEASNPIKLTQKLSYTVIEFFNYYLIQLFYKFFISKNNNEQYHLFNNIIKYLFIALICDSVLYFSFGINYPHLFVSLQFFLFISYPISKIKGDTKYLITWNIIITGIGAVFMVIISEIYFSENKIEFDFGDLNKFKKFIPKIFLLLMKNIIKINNLKQ